MLGNASLEVEHEEVAADVMAWLLPFQQRPVHELGRTALVLRAFEVWPPEEPVKFIDELFVRGDNAEREALLRTLPMLPDAGRFSVTAVEACRTNVLTVFDAIACENPYPARYFSELHFNQLVMKALFIGVSLRRIVCLSERITPGLRRMVRDHVKERTVADRPVHADTKLILNPLVTSGIR